MVNEITNDVSAHQKYVIVIVSGSCNISCLTEPVVSYTRGSKKVKIPPKKLYRFAQAKNKLQVHRTVGLSLFLNLPIL